MSAKANYHKTIKLRNPGTLSVILIALLSVIGLIIRLKGIKELSSGDMTQCLIPWYNEMPAHQGIGVLRNFTGNYGMPYATILWLLHYIPGEAHVKIKAFSVIFEYVAAFSVGLLSSYFYEGNRKHIAFVTGYALTLFYPVLIMNGAYWGQCDAIYASFVILMIWALFRNKPSLAMIFLGVAVAFKLQTVFILPFLIIFFFIRRNTSLISILLVPVTVEILYIPALLAGYSPLAPITIYLNQSSEYPRMYYFHPNLWGFFWKWSDYRVFHLPVICWVMMVFILVFSIMITRKKDLSDKSWIGLALVTSLLAVYFLPAMHERYSLIAELLAIVYAIIHPRRAWITAIIMFCISVNTNLVIFHETLTGLDYLSILLLAALICLSVYMIHDAGYDQNPITSISASDLTAKFTGLVNKYGLVISGLLFLGLFVIARKGMIRVYTPDYLSDLMNNETNYHTAIYMLFIRFLDLVGKFTGKEPYFLLKITCMGSDLAGVLIWTYILIRNNSREKTASNITFAFSYLLIPTTVFYSSIGGRLDGLCFALSGIGILFLMKFTESSKKSCFILSETAFAMALLIIPSYIILVIGLIIIFDIPIKKHIKEGSLGLLILLIIAAAGISSFKISGAVITPVCTLFLILAYKNVKYALPLLVMETTALFVIGRYMDVVEKEFYFLIPVTAITAVSISLITFFRYFDNSKHALGK